MQITRSGEKICLSRYGGSSKSGETRKALSVRIGSFRADVMPTFNTSPENHDEQSIPYAVFRSITPDEHDSLLCFIRELRLEELAQRIKKTTAELSSLTCMIPEATLELEDAKSLVDACIAAVTVLRKGLSLGAGKSGETRAESRAGDVAAKSSPSCEVSLPSAQISDVREQVSQKDDTCLGIFEPLDT